MPADDDVFSLSELPPVSEERWRARVLEGRSPGPALQARSIEGPVIEALYTGEAEPPRPRPPARAPGWRIGLEYGTGGAVTLAAALREDATRGLEVAWLELHDVLRAGAEASERGEGVVLSPADLGPVLDALGRGVALHVHAGAAAPALAQALLERRGQPSTRDPGEGGPADAVLSDPLATLAVTGGLGGSLDQAYAALAQTTRGAVAVGSSLRTVLVDAVGLHDAGASAEQEVAFVVAAGIEHLRRLQAQGLEPAAVMPRMLLRMAAGGELLVEVAKLRAARYLWARVRAHAGVGAGEATPLWVRTSRRSSTRRDPWVNLLRGTGGGLAAVLGGADVVAVQPFTEPRGAPEADARRWALGTQHILRGEAHLGRVDDPVAGSWAFEAVTEALARGAWAIAQRWLASGLGAAIEEGRVAGEVAERAAARSEALATGTLAAVGTSLYPWLDEPAPPVDTVPSVEPAPGGSPRVTAPRLARRRLAEPFEALRDRGEALARSLGRRARVALVPVGVAAQARAQIDFARNVVAVAGLESLVLEPGAELPAEVGLAIVGGPAEALAEHGPAEVRRLVAAGARVLVAGRPTDPLREAGVYDFVHRGRDVVALWSSLWPTLLSPPSEVDA